MWFTPISRLRTCVTQSIDCAHVLRNLGIPRMRNAISRLRKFPDVYCWGWLMRSVLILWTVEWSLALSVSGQYWGQKDLRPVEMAILGSPINDFNTEGYVLCAFPTLFPTGAADFVALWSNAVTIGNCFKHLLTYDDGRFAKHPRFCYFALNAEMCWRALQAG